MAAREFNSVKDLHPGSFNWKIKVRIIRFWRGVSRSGEEFKGFNLLLLDDKNDRIHAFAPGSIAEKVEASIEVGNIFTISNFTVKDYKTEERFRCIENNRQIVFNTFTKFHKSEEKDALIEDNMFDFFDLGDLHQIANKNIYLTDVIGVMEKDAPLRRFKNCNGEAQCQLKFQITDGRCSTNVTFWDSLAQDLEQKLSEDLEIPKIIIIASAKISSWQETIDISNVSATKFYINFNHYSVIQMRQMLRTPLFSKYDFSSQKPDKLEEFTIHQIRNLGTEYIQQNVVCNVKFTKVSETLAWYMSTCTTCFKEIRIVDGIDNCVFCDRIVPYPDKKFTVVVETSDKSGEMNIILEDRAVRTILGKIVFDVENEGHSTNSFPPIIKSIKNKEFVLKITMKEANILKNCNMYSAIDIYPKTDSQNNQTSEVIISQDKLHDTMPESSTETFHLDDLSQLTVKSPESIKKRISRRLKKKVIRD